MTLSARSKSRARTWVRVRARARARVRARNRVRVRVRARARVSVARAHDGCLGLAAGAKRAHRRLTCERGQVRTAESAAARVGGDGGQVDVGGEGHLARGRGEDVGPTLVRVRVRNRVRV